MKNYFTSLVLFLKKTFFYVNENKLPKPTGPHMLRNVLTLAAKQHRIITGHLTFQIKIFREAMFSTGIRLLKTLFFII